MVNGQRNKATEQRRRFAGRSEARKAVVRIKREPTTAEMCLAKHRVQIQNSFKFPI